MDKEVRKEKLTMKIKSDKNINDFLTGIEVEDKLRKLILYGSRINFSCVQMLSNPQYRDLTEILFNLELIKNVTNTLMKIHDDNVEQYINAHRS